MARRMAPPSPDLDPAPAPRAGRSTQLALAVLSGAIRPFADDSAAAPGTLTRLRTRLLAAPAPGEASRVELGALGTALIGAAFIGTTIPGAQPVGAQPQPVGAMVAAAPLAAAPAARAAATTDAATDTTDAAAGAAASAGDGATPAAADAATVATPTATQAPTTDAADAADDASGDAGDGSDPLAGAGGGDTLARVALIVVHGDAPVRWATAAPGSPARTRAATGTTFTGLAVLPGAPLATGLALIAGQPSNPATRAGCASPTPVSPGTVDAAGVTAGVGCDYPAETPSLAGAVARDGRTWKAYASAGSPAEAAAQLCNPAGAAGRSALAHLGDLAASGACDAAAAPLSALATDLGSDAAPAWVYVEVGACGTDGCDDAEAKARDADLDAALAALAAHAPADGGKAVAIVVGDGDVAGLEAAPAGAYPPSSADPGAPAAVLSGALLVGDGVERGGTDPLALDPFAIARTQATWLGLSAPGLAAAEGVTALAVPGA
jgi:hypothetical protein